MSIAIRQSAQKVVTAVTEASLAYGADLLGGSLSLEALVCHSGSGTLDSLTPTDTLGHVYTQTPSGGLTWITGGELSAWYNMATTAGPDSVTQGLDELGDLTMVIMEITGCVAVAPDAMSTAVGNSTTPSVPITTVVADAIIIGFFSHNGSERTLTEGADYTLVQESESAGGVPILVEAQIVSSAGARNADGAIGTGAVDWAIGAVAFAGIGPDEPAQVFPFKIPQQVG